MRKHLLMLSASVLVLAGGIAGANAQETPATPMTGQMQPGGGDMMMAQGMMGPGMMGPGMMGRHMMNPAMMRMIIAMLDTDGDGTLSLEEVQAVHARMFKAVDGDKNGRLTPEEVQRFMQGQ